MATCVISVDRGYSRKDAKAAQDPRLATMNAVGQKLNCDVAAVADTSETLPGERIRAADVATARQDDLPVT